MKSPDQSGSTSGVIPQSVLRSPSGADSQAPTSIGPGAVLDSKYLVGEVIGEGAFGIVYAARNLELDEKVALKVLRPEGNNDKSLVARFAREAKAAAAIKSEYVASVYDVGSTKNGPPFIVMEYLEGQDLGAFLEQKGPLPARTAVEYGLQICEALAVAHSKGIIHRDIKPENLLLTERAGGMRIVKVLDFGISKAALTGSIFGNDIPIVKTTNLVGTPLYMSPEQVRSADSLDVRSDIWSLGMVLYELLTGATAFDASSIPEICAAIIEKPPTPIEVYRNDLPAGLVDVLFRCLEKDINRRFPNVAELAVALMPFGPKRSRLNVERAIAVLKASGHVSASYEVLDSAYPPSSESASDSERLLSSSSALRLNLPRVESSTLPAPPSSGFPATEAATTKSKTLREAGIESIPAPTSASAPAKPKGNGTPLILGIVAILSVVAATAFVVRPMLSNANPPPPPPSAISVTPTAPAPTPSAEVAAPAKPPQTVETPSAEPKTAVKPPTVPVTPATPKWLAATQVHPKPGPSAKEPAAPTPAPAPAEAPAPADTSTGRTFRRGL